MLPVRKQTGASMIEVLISMFLVSTILLGVAMFAISALSGNRDAYFRSQANLLAYDLADRIRANADYALADDDNYSFNTSDAVTIPAGSNCLTSASGCSAQQLAAEDIRQWAENFIDLVGVGSDGADYEPLFPSGVGAVTVDDNSVEVRVQWVEQGWNTASGALRADGTHDLVLNFQVQ